MNFLVLAIWLGWLEHHPVYQKVVGLVSVQGTCLGCRFYPRSTFLSHISPFLSLSLSSFSKINKIYPQVRIKL